jgi:hypothetical protein
VLAVLLLAVATACGTSATPGANGAGARSVSGAVGTPAGTIVELGSGLLMPMMKIWAATYHQKVPGVTVSVNGGGSGLGIASAMDGKADIGASDAYLSSGDLVKAPSLRGDAILNVISRSGSTSFETDFSTVKAEIGPLLSAAAGNAQAAPYLAAAQRDAPAWYAANEQVYKLGASAQYQAERDMVIGTGPGSSAAGYDQLERDISQALAASQQTFRSGANSGASAFGPLEGVVIAASLLIAASSAWGLSRRSAEYR